MCGEPKYVSCDDSYDDIVKCNNLPHYCRNDSGDPLHTIFIITCIITIALTIFFPLICIGSGCTVSIIFAMAGAGFILGLTGGILPAMLCFLPVIYSIYTIRNIPYAINRCTRGLCDLANYAINKLANFRSRLARLVGFSGKDEQETDVESSSAEELSEIITMSSSQESESSEEQGQPQLPRRLSFASRAPFLSFYPPERTVPEAIPQRRPSFTSWTPFLFFRASSEETDLENGAMALSNSDSDNSYNNTHEIFHST